MRRKREERDDLSDWIDAFMDRGWVPVGVFLRGIEPGDRPRVEVVFG